MRNVLKFVTWPAIAGLLAALLILDRFLLPSNRVVSGPMNVAASYAQAVATATPSVVNIYTSKLVLQRPQRRPNSYFPPTYRQLQPRPQIEKSLGSGVIMSNLGHILTNNHVIAGADAIQVLLQDGRSAEARVIGIDEATDLAILHTELPGLQAIEPGDPDTIRVGDVVLAIGNPLGFGHSVTQGIISALGRYGRQLGDYADYIQTDATIHLGSSGGALVDTQGRLLGINTLIYTANNQSTSTPTGIGISLAIPVNQARFVMNDLIAYGKVIRGWLGVSVDSVSKPGGGENYQGQVLTVSAVSSGGPAQKAGIKPGDIITHIDNEPVYNGRVTMQRIALLRPGDSIAVTVQRRQQSIDLTAVLGVQRQSPTN
ncbi:MAG: PDZ domain-containing protein [Halieaceae bacterium]|jgi:serine protease DegS|nr:PDZ domain-containing protein [Halieaceae bacterium]